MKNRILLFVFFSLILSPFSSSWGKTLDVEKLKQEIKRELKQELRAEIKKELRQELEKEIVQDIRKELKVDVRSASVSTEPSSSPVKSKSEFSWSDKVDVSAQVRVRPEFRRNLTQTVPAVPGQREEDLSVLLRSRVGLKFKPSDRVHFFVQLQDSRDFGEEAAALPNAAGDDEGIDLHQGYLDFLNIGESDLSFRVGRQEVALGEQRLVGSVGWSNVGRSMDGFLFTYDKEKFSLKGLGAITNRTVTPGDGQYFGGLYTQWKGWPGGELDAYYFFLHDGDGAGGLAAGTDNDLNVHTFGVRAASQFDNGFDFGFESAIQVGEFGSNSILAFAEHARLGYTFQTSWKPRIGVEYNFATGDDTSSSRYTKFNNLFPTNHNKYGYMDLTGWSNMHDGVVNVSAKPHSKWDLSLAYHLLMVDKNESTTDTFATFAGAPGLGKIAGHEIDFLAQWKPHKYLSFLGGYSHFIPGEFFTDQGMNASADFVYIQAQADFK